MPETPRSPSPLVELSPAECLRLLSTVEVGRVGITSDALPAVLPVNFAVFEGGIVFRTVAGTKLDAATRGAVVAFEADAYEATEPHRGWSVLVRGVAREVRYPVELERVRALPLRAWAWDRAADRYVSVAAEMITGRRFGSEAETAAPTGGE